MDVRAPEPAADDAHVDLAGYRTGRKVSPPGQNPRAEKRCRRVPPEGHAGGTQEGSLR
jgi:hypothetical protein